MIQTTKLRVKFENWEDPRLTTTATDYTAKKSGVITVEEMPPAGGFCMTVEDKTDEKAAILVFGSRRDFINLAVALIKFVAGVRP